MIIQCDNCQWGFSMEGVQAWKEVRGNLTGSGFSCPKCGKRYTAFVTDTELVREIQKIKAGEKAIKAMIRKRLRKETIRKEQQRLEKRREKALAREKELKQRFEEATNGKIGEETASSADSGSV